MTNKGYQVKEYHRPVKRYCQTMDLKDNPKLIKEYILGSRLFMIIETPLDFDWETAMDRLSHLPRQAEWEEYVSKFQECVPTSTSAEKWKLMERMFHLYE